MEFQVYLRPKTTQVLKEQKYKKAEFNKQIRITENRLGYVDYRTMLLFKKKKYLFEKQNNKEM